MLKVTTIESKMKAGINNPIKVTCSNSNQYVMKCMNKDTDGKSLFNELVAARFAKLISLPTPTFEIGILEKALIQKNGILKSYDFKPGPCFLSKFVNGTALGINPINAKNISNIEIVPCIILFDAILMNSDRGPNKGNWFFTQERKLIALDHTNIFKMQIWSENSLQQDRKIPPAIVSELYDPSYSILIDEYKNKYKQIHHPFSPFIRKIKQLSASSIDNCFSNIPNDWNITKGEITAANDFILFQLDHIHDLNLELENIFNF